MTVNFSPSKQQSRVGYNFFGRTRVAISRSTPNHEPKRKLACAALVLLASAAALPAQTFTTLHSFHGSDSKSPQAALTEGANGQLYGTAGEGGASADGTIFSVTKAGQLTTVYSFCSQPSCADGALPSAGLVQTPNRVLYGTTSSAGANSFYAEYGTVFKVSGGTVTTLYSFCSKANCADGAGPMGGLVLAANGAFYGTTGVGGASDSCFLGCGTIFKITPAGALTSLYSFCSQPSCADGSNPEAGLVLATDGNLYGTTREGGLSAQGTVFKISPAGALTTLYSFCSKPNCSDGAGPVAGLIQTASGDFYGTTKLGGLNCVPNGCGTIFKLSSTGEFTTLYSFCAQPNCADGQYPSASLIQATDGNLYGTTQAAGANSNLDQYGTAFRITTSGSLTTLYSFCSSANCADGAAPVAGLVQATDGNLYGTTEAGGTYGEKLGGWGTVFKLSVGLGPFVKTLSNSGHVGATIEILGTSLNGATQVSFNGSPAEFSVASSTLISATIPAGATSGIVQVVSPSGILSSYLPFSVLP